MQVITNAIIALGAAGLLGLGGYLDWSATMGWVSKSLTGSRSAS